MKFEDVLPAIKVGRLARRVEWKAGECVGANPYNMRTGAATSLSKFSRYDNDGSSSTWCNVSIDKDMLAEDWELVPEPLPRDTMPAILRDALSEIALHFESSGPETYPNDTLPKNLSMMVHEALEAYKTENPDRLMGALLHGVGALITMRTGKDLEDFLSRKMSD